MNPSPIIQPPHHSYAVYSLISSVAITREREGRKKKRVATSLKAEPEVTKAIIRR